ncbi:hypothetical protein [Pedobacter punctiformis]|uniref:Uncharacterized protein n=1 Tax=Pedobacter punctiformis TaxID=3004097 RepID=A0ABT4L892_9SPHI|nr:hypothetical protein [Pedobacter sp. HCMS5-2]MCZ4244130.1 hypothetical protein [Pedobacter sp. HCMS5-2]
MKRIIVVPFILITLQIISIVHLLYTYQYGDSHIPAAFIELNILSLTSFLMSIIAYFSYLKTGRKVKVWLVVIALSLLVIIALIIVYAIMLTNKYQ